MFLFNVATSLISKMKLSGKVCGAIADETCAILVFRAIDYGAR